MKVSYDGLYAGLLIFMIIHCGLLLENLGLGLDALDVTKNRVDEIKKKIPAIQT